MIKFTQYLRPNGRTTEIDIDRSTEIEKKAIDLIKLNCKFEIEELMTGMVSMTVEYPYGHEKREESPFVMELVPNGSKVPEIVDKLINRAWEKREELKNSLG